VCGKQNTDKRLDRDRFRKSIRFDSSLCFFRCLGTRKSFRFCSIPWAGKTSTRLNVTIFGQTRRICQPQLIPSLPQKPRLRDFAGFWRLRRLLALARRVSRR
jgi:hypothetical protein